ncbi:MAG: exodeoxyribonuclease VII small subunit [Candidatus Omnitrophota bacterium]
MTTKKIDFEKALHQLQTIVEELETGELPLDEAIKKFKIGSALAKQCLEMLDSIKVKVEEVVGEEKGKLKRKPFKPEN